MTEDIKQILDDHEQRLSKLEKLFEKQPDVVNKNLSIKEFILLKKPKGDVEKTLVIGYYLEKHAGLSSFNAKDLEDGFEQAKEGTPANINYKAIKNIQKGFFKEVKEKKDELKAWNLTNSGERVVENELKSC